MSFKIALSETYRAPVEVTLPNEAGEAETSEFTAVFRRCTTTQLTELAEKSPRLVMAEVLAGWDGLVNGDETVVPVTVDTRAALLEIPQALQALNQSFWTSVSTARAKN